MIGKENVLNIRTNPNFNWVGQTGATRGFCDFSSVDMARRAGVYLLKISYRQRGVTKLCDVIARFAPPSENQTDNYVSYVSGRTGIRPDLPLTFDSDYAQVLTAMEIYEQGVPVCQRTSYYDRVTREYLRIIDEYFSNK